MFSFKEQSSFEERKAESTEILNRFKSRIPVICENHTREVLGGAAYSKFLVKTDMTALEFQYVLRRQIDIGPEHAITLLVGAYILPTSSLFSSIYEQFKEMDGFLYISFTVDDAFG